MQELADCIVGGFVVWVFYKFFLHFGLWMERRSERISDETKKGAEKNGQ